MTDKKYPRLRAVGTDILREVVAYSMFLIISGLLSGILLLAGTVLTRELRIDNQPVYIAISALLPLSFYSIHRAFELYDREARDAFPYGSTPRYTFLGGMRILFTTPVLLRKLAVHLSLLLLFIILLPYEVGFRWLVAAFYPALDMARPVAEVLSALIACPVLALTLILAKTSAHKWWLIAPTGERERLFKKGRTERRLALEILKITLIYAVCFPVLPSVFMLGLSAVLTFGEFAVGIWIGLAVLLVLIALLRSLIAIGRRRSFLRRLRRAARAGGYTLSKIQRPITSVFFPDMDEDFTLTRDGVTYTCKLIGTAHRRRPMYISPKGVITEKRTVSFMKMTLFHVMRDTRYDIAGENKIVILSPMPKRVYVNYGRAEVAPDDGDGSAPLASYVSMVATAKGGFRQSRATDRSIHGPGYISDVDRGIIKPFETGERVGDTRFFTPSGFISAMDNGCLDRTDYRR